MPPEEPIRNRSTKHNPKDRPGIIHIICCDWQERRERQPDQNENQEADCESIDSVPPRAEGEGSPGCDFAAEFGKEEGGDDLQVGHVEGEVVEGEDGVDGGGGGDVDQHEEGHDCEDEAEGVEGDAEGWVAATK
jgi:hypothetical protein